MPTYTYASLSDPLATEGTDAIGINIAGQIVGYYFDSSFHATGFLYAGGAYTTLSDPLATGGTYATGINDVGQFVGQYRDVINNHSFVYSGGTYTTLDDPLSFVGTFATGINDAGQIVGYYVAGAYPYSHGYLYSNGTYTTLDDPLGAEGTWAFGINDKGQIVGNYTDSGGVNHGFLYSGGTYITLNDPSGSNTIATGINDAGQIVGFYYGTDPTSLHGFVYSGGTYITLDDPLASNTGLGNAGGVKGTVPSGINDAGQIVGYYVDSSGGTYGFVASAQSPTVASISATTDNNATDVNAGHLVTITMTTSESVTVTGTPALQLNDNEVATYSTGSGNNTLTFTYTVQPGDNVADLKVTGLNLPSGAAIQDAAGNNLSGSVTGDLGIQIDTTVPALAITSAGSLTNHAMQTVSGTIDTADANLTVSIYDGSTLIGTAAPTANGNWSTSVTLLSTQGAQTITAQATDAAGNLGTSRPVTYTVDTTPPMVASISPLKFGSDYFEYISAPGISWAPAEAAAASMSYLGATGYLATVTSAAENDFLLSLVAPTYSSFSGAWLGGEVFGGVGPGGSTLQTDGGSAYWEVGPLEGQLFSVGQNAVPGAYANWGGVEPNDSVVFSAVYMNVGTGGWGVSTGQWADAQHGLASGDPFFTGDNMVGYFVEFTPSSVVPSLSAGRAVTVTVNLTEAVIVTGIPTLQLNDNEVATYTKGSGNNTLTFTYTVQPGDNVADLKVTGLNLPSGAAIQDAAGNNLSGSVTGDLGIRIDTSAGDHHHGPGAG